jgi:glycosyltransferase involved in cell wall biosynthesis
MPSRQKKRMYTASNQTQKIRVLYSFPHKLGAGRICYTAWQQVEGLVAAGADLLVFPGAIHGAVPSGARVRPTLSLGKIRVPYKLLGRLRAFALHDYIVARRIEELVGKIDIIHTWPLGALQTLKAAARLGIPTVLERPNAHTRTYYGLVQKECHHLGIVLPETHEHAYDLSVVEREEEEYRLAYRLLCPSEFVVQTFLKQGFPLHKLARHRYGYDDKIFFPVERQADPTRGLTMIFVGVCVPAKGLHHALKAWLESDAHRNGSFLIAGEFLPSYADKLSPMLSHPSVKVLGQRSDIANLLRKSDLLVLPSVGEGFGLVCAEAIGSGCVPLASDACTDVCKHMENSLVHSVGDVEALKRQINTLHLDRALLQRLREGCIRSAPQITWRAAGRRLFEVYGEVVTEFCGSVGSSPALELK